MEEFVKLKLRAKVVEVGCLILALLIPMAGAIITSAPMVWPLSTLIYNCGLLMFFAYFRKLVVRLFVYNIVAVSLFVVEVTYFVSYYLQDAGFNDAFFYHLRLDIFYAGVNEHLTLLFLILVCMAGFMALASVAINSCQHASGWASVAAVILFLGGIFISPPVRALVHHFGNQAPLAARGELLKKFPELVDSSLSVQFTKTKRPNIVMIYAESLERRFFDESIFPNLVPNLKKIKQNSMDFANVSQGVGAGWTIGGIVASQCAYPLAVEHDVDKNDLNLFDNFLPKATCLGDLLEKDGFRLSFLGGADARFAGKAKFLRSHGYTDVLGLQELKGSLPDQNYVTPWGLYDDSMFEYAMQKFHALSGESGPFMLTLLTLDSHGFDGYKSASCQDYQPSENSILNSIHCADQLIGWFIEQVRTSQYSNNTIIVVASDHLVMRNKATPLLEESQQKERLTFFINAPSISGMKNDNPGLHYDIAPTILDVVGYEIAGQMGFGNALTKGAGYLPEKFGETGWTKLSPQVMAVGASLWDNEVSLDRSGIDFTVAGLSLSFGGRKFNLSAGGFIDVPSTVAFLYDQNTLKLEKIYSYPLEQGLTKQTLGNLLVQNKEKLALVISRAGNLIRFSDQHLDPDQWVFFFGQPGGEHFAGGPIKGDFSIPFDLIEKVSHSKASLR